MGILLDRNIELTFSLQNRVRLVFIMLIGFSFLPLMAQQEQITQDPEAREILDRVAARVKQMKSVQADFELVIEDRKENTKNKSAGNLLIKQDKYKITTTESVVYYDGKTMWTYMIGNHEVTITEPDNSDEDFLNNPAKIFTWYNRDFKYRYVRETIISGTKYHEIDLYPINLNQPYSRIKIFVSQKNDMPEIISSIGKDGVDYTVNLRNFQLDREISDAAFVFDTLKNKKVEVVDMRGVK
jgi:outer membrane lipoprotein carrier protein